jgi:hypothetical protein
MPNIRAKFINRAGVRAGNVASVPQRSVEESLHAERALSEQKRRQLEVLRNREKVKTKRERLANVLAQKLIVKYGSQHKVFINTVVDTFLAEKDQITGEDLAALEREVIAALNSHRQSKLAAAATTALNNNNFSDQQSRDYRSDESASKMANNDNNLLERPPSGSEWMVLNTYAIQVAEEKLRQEEEVARMKKIMFKKSLDDHIAIAKSNHARSEVEDDKAYAAKITLDVKSFHEEEKRKRDAIHHKHQHELAQRKQQIEDQKMREKEMRLRERQTDEAMLAMAAFKIEQEKEKFRMIKHKEKEVQAIIDKVYKKLFCFM